MDTQTTRDRIADEPRIEDFDILLAFAKALSDPQPEVAEKDPGDETEAFLKLARAH